MTIAPYPLLFEPILKPKVWGGRALARLGKALPDGELVGESWEVADLAASAAGGGGGGQERSRIVGGALHGATLADAMRRWGAGLLGEARPAHDGGFPLLIKLLDARENLSVQVHPPTGWTGVAGAQPKSECWYIVHSEIDARIWRGLRPGVGADDLASLMAEDRLPEALLEEPAEPGRLFWLPGGTVHALGAGIQVLEVQTPSDTTFRLYDWTREYDRRPRELHHVDGLACASLGPPPPSARKGDGVDGQLLLDGPDFSVEERWLPSGGRWPAGDGARPTVLHVLSGRIVVGVEGPELGPGATCLVPAATTARTELSATVGPARLLLIRPA